MHEMRGYIKHKTWIHTLYKDRGHPHGMKNKFCNFSKKKLKTSLKTHENINVKLQWKSKLTFVPSGL